MDNITAERNSNDVSTILKPEAAREVLNALCGPRNTHIELFPKPCLVNTQDLKNLTKLVAAKLGQLQIVPTSTVMKVVISYEKDRSFELIGWDQLEVYEWKTPERTNSLILSWEFFYQKSKDSSAELHSLTVRISEALNGMYMLRALLSPDTNDVDRLSIKMAPIVCEVNYVDSLLSRELVQLVSRWNDALRKPISYIAMGDILFKYQGVIKKSVKYSLEFLMPLAYICAVYVWMDSQFSYGMSTRFISLCAIFIMTFFFSIKFSDRFAALMSNLIEKRIERMSKFPVFELTDGDQNKVTEAFARMKSSTIRFWLEMGLSFFINIAASVFMIYLVRSLDI